MEQRASTGRAVNETTDKTQIHSHMKEDQEHGEKFSAPQDSAQSDSDASNAEIREETQVPSPEVDNGGRRDSDKKLGRISPSVPTRAEHETDNNSEGDHHTQEEEEQQEEEEEEEEKGRERLKRHQAEVAGCVGIPEIWGQEELLKDWVDCSVFEASLVPAKIISAKAALAEEGRKANSDGLGIDNSC
ncbi:protein BIC1-like [Rhodamnia argentea]|uniref:Protein BIC1-like n=1 Tax=Rhodamnia argentea TaxID=178133 RepID=A0A8B8MUK9_9MYRT|nr:protein BIC1-like [Rhodamnia argentea]